MAGCDVCIGGFADDSDGPEFCKETNPKARKRYECGECQGFIHPGDSYEKMVGKWDGQLITFRTCEFCAEVRAVFSCEDSIGFEELWELMNEVAFPKLTTASPCFKELSLSAKARLLERWQYWKGLKTSKPMVGRDPE